MSTPPRLCVICGNWHQGNRELTCSQKCHEEFIGQLEARYGKYKKVVRASTGEVFQVPVRDIIEKGIREQDLDQYERKGR